MAPLPTPFQNASLRPSDYCRVTFLLCSVNGLSPGAELSCPQSAVDGVAQMFLPPKKGAGRLDEGEGSESRLGGLWGVAAAFACGPGIGRVGFGLGFQGGRLVGVFGQHFIYCKSCRAGIAEMYARSEWVRRNEARAFYWLKHGAGCCR